MTAPAPEHVPSTRRSLAPLLVVLATLILAAVIWLGYFSPQAQVARGERAQADTVAWLRALEDSFRLATTPLTQAQNAFYDRRGRFPRTVRDYVAAGLDSTQLSGDKDNPQHVAFTSGNRTPRWRREATDPIRVSVRQGDDGSHYTSLVLLGSEIVWCEFSITTYSSLRPRCAFSR